jgi:hypothetical protein
MGIYKKECLELGLPEPKDYEKQRSYITRTIASGFNLNTRICRYIGIFNLHSQVAALYSKGLLFTWAHGLAECPFTHEVPREQVIIIYMTKEQQERHKKENPPKK